MRADNPMFRPCANYGTDAVGPGWEQILVDLDQEFVKILGYAGHLRMSVAQIKEKFGGLRVYFNHVEFRDEPDVVEKLRAAVSQAEKRSFETCEMCGQPGKTGGSSWAKTFCPEHHQERELTGENPLRKVWEERNRDKQVMRPRN